MDLRQGPDERYNEIGLLGGIAAGCGSYYLASNIWMAVIHAVLAAVLLSMITRFISRNLTFIIIVGGMLYLAYRD